MIVTWKHFPLAVLQIAVNFDTESQTSPCLLNSVTQLLLSVKDHITILSNISTEGLHFPDQCTLTEEHIDLRSTQV